MNRSPNVSVPAMLWMVGGNPAVIVSFDVIMGADMMRPLEEIALVSWNI